MIVWLLVCVLALSTGAYFIIAESDGVTKTAQDLLLAVISNLIPVVLVAIVSLTIIRDILDQYRQSEYERLEEGIAERLDKKFEDRIATTVSAALTGQTPPDIDGLKQILSREFRNALIESAPVRQLNDPPPDAGVAKLNDARRALIGDILHTMSVALIFPRPRSRVFIRSFCHLADHQSKTLRPICMWSSERETEDYDAVIPYTGLQSRPFVIAEAFTSKRLAKKNLSPDHVSTYPDELRDKILPELCGVIAVPISAYSAGVNDEPLGTISIDSTLPLEELGFHDETVREVLIWGARAVRQVLLMEG